MLLKVGIAMTLFSLVLAAGVAVAVGLQDEPSETANLSAESPAIEVAEKEMKADPGKKPKKDRTTKSATPQPAPESESPPSESLPKSTPQPAPLPDWPEPTDDQLAFANQPRYYQAPSDADMTLTIEALKLYNVPTKSSANYEVLDRGLMHEPETSLPWDGGVQRNVFIAGHYLGWPGTASHLVFYNLDKLRSGDEVVLEDRQGRSYRYRVSESFGAMPEDSWVMGQEVGRDMLTLQTCIPPNFEKRLIVRAERV